MEVSPGSREGNPGQARPVHDKKAFRSFAESARAIFLDPSASRSLDRFRSLMDKGKLGDYREMVGLIRENDLTGASKRMRGPSGELCQDSHGNAMEAGAIQLFLRR